MFSFFTITERLAFGELTFTKLNRLRKTLTSMILRGSRLCYDDILSAVETIIRFPFIGGKKGVMTMIDQLYGVIGETTYKKVKEVLKDLVEDTFQKREVKSELEKNMHQRKRTKSKRDKAIRSQGVNDIWSIDFTEIKAFGVKLYGCVVYELYSQGYMAVEISLKNDANAACDAWRKAIENAGGTMPNTLISDNGSHFNNELFNLCVGEKVNHTFTPPGKPWLNGALESGNKDLKKALYSQMTYMLENDKDVCRVGASVDLICQEMQNAANRTMSQINMTLVRSKFNVTPQTVLDGRIAEALDKQNKFREEREVARKNMLDQVKSSRQKLKTLKEKIKQAWHKLEKDMSDDKLYAFRELINGRFQTVKN